MTISIKPLTHEGIHKQKDQILIFIMRSYGCSITVTIMSHPSITMLDLESHQGLIIKP